MNDLITWLRAQLDAREQELAEDEQWARAASQAYPYSPQATVPADGVHWRWVSGENWDDAVIDPVVNEFVAEPGYSCNLSTVEKWPTSDGHRAMPRTYADQIVEMDASAAGHIARWDPNRVLREVATERADINAKRRMLEWIEDLEAKTLNDNLWNIDAYHPLLLIAQPYAGRDGWRTEWAITPS